MNWYLGVTLSLCIAPLGLVLIGYTAAALSPSARLWMMKQLFG